MRERERMGMRMRRRIKREKRLELGEERGNDVEG